MITRSQETAAGSASRCLCLCTGCSAGFTPPLEAHLLAFPTAGQAARWRTLRMPLPASALAPQCRQQSGQRCPWHHQPPVTSRCWGLAEGCQAADPCSNQKKTEEGSRHDIWSSRVAAEEECSQLAFSLLLQVRKASNSTTPCGSGVLEPAPSVPSSTFLVVNIPPTTSSCRGGHTVSTSPPAQDGISVPTCHLALLAYT